MRKPAIAILIVLLPALAWLSFSRQEKKVRALHGLEVKTEDAPASNTTRLLHIKSTAAKAFAIQNGLDTSVCFLIDMNLPSNQKRFFVYNLKKDTILQSGLVTHGNCNQYWLQGRKYGNGAGCGCTSLGRYRIGNFYYGKFGLAFKLFGLDKTNSNAYKRYVVLHSHNCVPDTGAPEEICQSNGCPTVSPSFLKQLQAMIKNSRMPILLWIYDDASK